MAYNDRLFEFIGPVEGFRPKVYEDIKGLPTIGYGFNLDASGAEKRFKKALPDVSYQAAREGKVSLTEEQSRKLFDESIDDVESIARDKIGEDVWNKLPEHQRVALTSLAYNSPALIGPNLTKQIQNGRIEDAIGEIILRSNKERSRGLQNRRTKEADMMLGPNLQLAEVYPDVIDQGYSRIGKDAPAGLAAITPNQQPADEAYQPGSRGIIEVYDTMGDDIRYPTGRFPVESGGGPRRMDDIEIYAPSGIEGLPRARLKPDTAPRARPEPAGEAEAEAEGSGDIMSTLQGLFSGAQGGVRDIIDYLSTQGKPSHNRNNERGGR